MKEPSFDELAARDARAFAAWQSRSPAARWRWMKDPGIPNVQAPLSFCGPYVISHRFIYQVIGGLKGCHTLSYRPPGEHHHIGSYDTARVAMAEARKHAKGLRR